MPVLKVIIYGNPVLRKKAAEVKEIDDEIKGIIKDMELALSMENGVGLAAPQIGISKRILLVDLTKSKEAKKIVLLNPRFIYKSAETEETEEGCLSVPGVWGTVSRPYAVKVKGTLPNGRSILVQAEGLYARAIQHEMDHLDGKLFIDYLSPEDRQKNRELIEAIVRKNQEELGEGGIEL